MLEARGVRKSYGGVVALAGADLVVRPGTVHALLGENGAGKSTLVKAIAGALTPDEGVVTLDGREVRFRSTREAAAQGVAVVSQELNLFPDLDVLANLYPMREPKRGPFVDRGRMAREAQAVLDELQLDVPLRRPLGELTLAQRQQVEIAKALLTSPRVLILDEPTSALGQASTQNLLDVLRVLRDRDVGVVFVSHILEDVMALCDEITVLRDGAVVLSAVPRAQLTVPAIVAAMLGDQRAAPAAERVAEQIDAGERARLRFEGVRVDGAIDAFDAELAGGEIIGLTGVAGAGHLAVLELVSGLRRASAGRVLLPSGRPVPHGLRAAVRAGVALVTGDRRRLGLMLDKSIWENVAQVRAVGLAADGPWISAGRLRRRAQEQVERLRVRSSSVEQPVGLLSGGNQQKVVFAKWLEAHPSVILLDDPTRGVDVGAKAEMHALVRSAADAGAVVLICSTDVDELVDLCDAVYVFHQHRVCARLSGAELDAHAVLEAMNTGVA
jgi:ABC-type sugar transport system ATPase subunit